MSLPKVYANEFDKVINNNRDVYYEENNNSINIEKLKSYFDENGYVNRLEVNFKLKNGDKRCKLVLCKSNYFVTLDNEKVYFDDIVSYEIKK